MAKQKVNLLFLFPFLLFLALCLEDLVLSPRSLERDGGSPHPNLLNLDIPQLECHQGYLQSLIRCHSPGPPPSAAPQRSPASLHPPRPASPRSGQARLFPLNICKDRFNLHSATLTTNLFSNSCIFTCSSNISSSYLLRRFLTSASS